MAPSLLLGGESRREEGSSDALSRLPQPDGLDFFSPSPSNSVLETQPCPAYASETGERPCAYVRCPAFRRNPRSSGPMPPPALK
jgi:hypothetical protein